MIKTFLYFSAFFSIMWETKCQIQLKGIRHNRINVEKNTKFDFNVSQMQNPVDFYGRFQPWSENIPGPFLILENFLLQKLQNAVNIA